MRIPGYLTTTLLLASGIAAAADRQPIATHHPAMPLTFERNAGQVADPSAAWVGHGPGYQLRLNAAGATIVPSAAGGSAAVRMKFLDARTQAGGEPIDPLPGKTNYLLGRDPRRWIQNLPTWGRIRYRDVYDGIDAVWYGNQGQLEYDFVVRPGANPSRIRVGFEGALKLAMESSGDVRIETSAGAMTLRLPQVYQEIGGERREVRGRYRLRGSREVAFELAAYDRSRPLVIDPTLVYGTYFGGGNLGVSAMATDTPGNVYVGGDASGGLPTAAPLQAGVIGNGDVWIAKFDPTGTLLYSTYVGGSGYDDLRGIAITPNFDVIATGQTQSSDFPLASPVQSQGPPSGQDLPFVFKLNASGSAFLYSTYLGGASPLGAMGWAVATDAAGDAYVAGEADDPTFFTTPGVWQTTYGGGFSDAFVAKLGPTGTLVYETLLGGDGAEMPAAIAVDSAGNAYVAGVTGSSSFANNPPGAVTSSAGNLDTFVAKLNPTATAVTWLTFLGGSGNDAPNAMVRDPASGILYLAGSTTSTDLPVTAGAIQPASNGPQQGFLASINPDGTSGFVTYLGGNREDTIQALALTPAGQLAVGGHTTSTNFPLQNAIETGFQGTETSLYASANSGSTWTAADSGLPTSVGAILADPSNPGTMIAASASSFAWYRTTDNGISWVRSGESKYPLWWHVTGGQFARSLSNPAVLYFCYPESVGEGTTGHETSWGIAFGSSDGGATWRELSAPATSNDALWGIAVNTTDSNTILEVTYSGAVYRSTDGGKTVTKVTSLGSSMTWAYPDSLVTSSDDSVYVATQQNVYKSTDFGNTWTSASSHGIPDGEGMGPLAVSASNPSVVYAGAAWQKQLYKTTDAGSHWQQVTNPGLNLGNMGATITIAPSNSQVVYVTSNNQAVVSKDGGTTWSQPSNLPGNISSLAISPSDPTAVWVATAAGTSDGFAAKTSTDGKTLLWSTLYTGSQGSSVTAVAAVAPSDVWIAGSTSGSDSSDLPVTPNAYSLSGYDGAAFLARISDSTALCTFSLNPTSIIAYAGGTGSFSITAPSGCGWTATPSDSSWITVQTPAGAGSGVIYGSVVANPGNTTRTGSIDVGGQSFAIVEPAANCTYSASDNGNLPSAGGTVTVTITAPAGCPWGVTPVSSLTTVTGSATGTGNGTVTLSLPANDGVTWVSTTVSVGNRKITISEADICTYSVLPLTLGGRSASGTMTVTVNDAGCQWSPQSDAGWLSVSGGGNGSGSISYQVQANNTLGPRTAHMTLDNRQFTVTQGNSGAWTIGEQQLPLIDTSGNGNRTWTQASGSPPPGLSIRTDVPSWFPAGVKAGLIGVATTPGTYDFTLSADNGAPQPFHIKITALTLKDPSNDLPNAFVGASYNYQLTALNGAGPVTFTPTSGVPAGMSLSASGLLSGTPNSAGFYNISFSFTDGTDTLNRTVNLNVSPVQITSPGMLPNATQYAAYSQTLSAAGGVGPYTFSGGGLPNGLSLSSTGAITGTVNSGEGSYPFNVRVSDSQNHSYSENMVIDVIGTPESMPQLSIYGTLDDPTIGQGYWRGIRVNGGTAPHTWAVSGLPPGMDYRSGAGTTGASITPDDVELWGTPTAAGAYNVTVTATDSLGLSTTQVYPLNVSALLVDAGLQNGTVNAVYSSSMRIVGGVLPYSAVEVPSQNIPGTLPAGTSLAGLTVSGMPVEVGGFNPRFLFSDSAGTANTLTTTENFNISDAAGASINLNGYSTLYVTLNQRWSFQLGACCVPSYTWTQIGGNIPHGITLSSGGMLNGTPDTAGSYTFLVQATQTGNASNYGTRQLTIVVTPLTVTTPYTLPFGNANAAYSQTLAASGGSGSLTWALAAGNFAPPGITLSTTGVLSGMPTASGAYYFSVSVSDSAGHSAVGNFNLNIYPPGGSPPPSIDMGTDFGTWHIGTIWFGLAASGGNGAYTWSVASGALPPGLALRTDMASFFAPNQPTGIAGVATTAGTYHVTLSVTSGGQTVSQAFTMKINRLDLQDMSPPDAFAGNSYRYAFTPVGNAGPVTFSVNSNSTNGAMPPGLTLSSAGVLAGTPSSAGNYQIAMNVSDGVDTAYEQYNLNVYAVDITTPALLPNGSQSSAYSTSLSASGGTGGYTWTLQGGLPNGLTLSPDGVISGSINSGWGAYTFNVTATDSQHSSYSKSMLLDVIGMPPAPMQVVGSPFNDAVVGTRYGTSPGVCCGGAAPFTFSVSGLPPGLTTGPANNPNNISIYGVPQATGTYNIQVTVTDVTGASTSQIFPLHVSTLDARLDSAAWNPPNGTIGVPYNVGFHVLGGAAPYTAVNTVISELPDGLALDPNVLTLSGTPLENGFFGPFIQFGDSGGDTLLRGYGFSIGGGASNININGNGYNGYHLGTTPAGAFYSTGFSACCGASLTWSVPAGSTLPTGLGLSGSGQLSGTPTAPGTYRFLIAAADSGNSANVGMKSFVLVVTPISITTQSLPDGGVGIGYAASLGAGGGSGTLHWSEAFTLSTQLPPGLTLAANGAIGGTPLSAGSYGLTLQVTDGAGNIAIRGYRINVVNPVVQTIAFGALAAQFVNALPFPVGATASSGMSVSFGSLTPAVCTVSGSTVTLVKVGKCTVQATQGGSAYYLPAAAVSQDFLVVSLCDLDMKGSVTAGNVRSVINEALGVGQPVHDMNGDGAVSVIEVQVEINAAVGSACMAK